jgi:hypothetical protein
MHKCIKCGSNGGPRRILSAVKIKGKLVVMCSFHAALHYGHPTSKGGI